MSDECIMNLFPILLKSPSRCHGDGSIGEHEDLSLDPSLTPTYKLDLGVPVFNPSDV